MIRLRQLFLAMKIRDKLFLSYALLVLVSIMTVSFVTYFYTSNTLVTTARKQSEMLLGEMIENFSTRAKQVEDALYIKYNFTEYSPFSESKNDVEKMRSRIYYYNDVLWNLAYPYSFVNSILIVDTEGSQHYVRKVDSTVDHLQDYLEMDNGLFLKSLYGKCYWSGGDDSLVIVKRALYDVRSTQYIGYLIASVKASYFENNKMNQLDEQFVILGTNGNLVYSSNQMIPISYTESMKNSPVLHTENGLFKQDSIIYNVTNAKSNDSRWEMLNIVNVEKLTASARELQQIIITGGVGFLLLALVIASYLSKGFSSNINKLVTSVQLVSTGELDAKIENASRDEIGVLTNEFNLMIDKIHLLMGEIKQKEILKRDAEIKQIQFHYSALQAQLNPHFLYNTLETINSLAKMKGDDDISDIICSLGRLLRVAVDKDVRIVTLKSELQFIRDYVEIYKKSCNNNLSLFQSVETGLEEAYVPKLILQPIVENSIMHGFDALKTEGVVDIDVFSDNGFMYITVSDNGKGLDGKTTLPQTMTKKEDEPQMHYHVGLTSVMQRLNLLYGDASDVSVYSVAGEGVTVTLKLPLNQNGDEIDELQGNHR